MILIEAPILFAKDEAARLGLVGSTTSGVLYYYPLMDNLHHLGRLHSHDNRFGRRQRMDHKGVSKGNVGEVSETCHLQYDQDHFSHYVIEFCLRIFSHKDVKLLLSEKTNNFSDIATDR
ncbi:hypothetical protein RJ641_011616 [Dillenia turbinata]|uniref:Uncharacterized protein n=1 Tax=Dillenia turbinata TaxID=194707 RepID=A0AAN8Z3I6_9MAGN